MSFEQATREKWRYAPGQMSVEDLWDLPLQSAKGTSLDSIAIALHKEIKQLSEESFVNKQSTVSANLKSKFDIVKYIIDTKINENEQKRKYAEFKLFEEQIQAISAKKELAALENKSVEELQQMVAQAKQRLL